MRVLIAMSGGVDSGVTALLLARQGYECIGATMLLAEDVVATGSLPSAEVLSADDKDWSIADPMVPHPLAPVPEPSDVADARSICRSLGIEHRVIDACHAFERRVVAPFVNDYVNGLTPNPCVVCNRLVKFGLLWEVAQELGCDAIATGHYARVERDNQGRPWIVEADDVEKDQSYVLYPVPEEVLEHLVLPLGEAPDKTWVRTIAEQAGLTSAHKSDSQDICFVPDGNYTAFVERNTKVGPHKGQILSTDGTCLGWHMGHERFTLGQRKGLGVSVGKRVYVVGKDTATNTVYVGDEEQLMVRRVTVDNAVFAPGCPEESFQGEVVTCYHGFRHKASIVRTGASTFEVRFESAVRAPTPGQSAVVYLGNRVACGGVMIKTSPC